MNLFRWPEHHTNGEFTDPSGSCVYLCACARMFSNWPVVTWAQAFQQIAKTRRHAGAKDEEEGAWQVLPAAYASAAWDDLHGIFARDEPE